MMKNQINQKGFLGWIISLTFLGIFTISGIAIYLNLPNSLPGDLIYPIKEISENLNLSPSYEFDDLGRAQVYTKLSNNRMDEIRKLITKREKDDKIIQTLERLELMQKRALENIERARNRQINITKQLSILEMSLQKQQDYLRKSLFELSPKIDDAIGKAIDSTADNLERVNAIRGR